MAIEKAGNSLFNRTGPGTGSVAQPIREANAAAVNGGEVKIVKPSLAALFKSKGGPQIVFWNDGPDSRESEALRATGRYGDFIQANVIENKLREALARRGAVSREILSRYSQPAGPDFAAAVAASLGGASAGMGLGAQLGGPVAAASVGGAAFLGTLIKELVPERRMAAEAAWARVVDSMTPVERYGLLAYVRPIATENARAENKVFQGGSVGDPCGPWRWADDPPAGHTIFGGQISRTVALMETLFRQKCVPDSVSQDNTATTQVMALYLLLAVAGAHDDEKQCWQMRELWPYLRDGKTAPAYQEYFRAQNNKQLGALRRQANEGLIHTIFNPPISPAMARELEK